MRTSFSMVTPSCIDSGRARKKLAALIRYQHCTPCAQEMESPRLMRSAHAAEKACRTAAAESRRDAERTTRRRARPRLLDDDRGAEHRRDARRLRRGGREARTPRLG